MAVLNPTKSGVYFVLVRDGAKSVLMTHGHFDGEKWVTPVSGEIVFWSDEFGDAPEDPMEASMRSMYAHIAEATRQEREGYDGW